MRWLLLYPPVRNIMNTENIFVPFYAVARPHPWGQAWAVLLAEYEARETTSVVDPLVELEDIEEELDVIEGGHHPFSYEAEAPRRALRNWKAYRATQHK